MYRSSASRERWVRACSGGHPLFAHCSAMHATCLEDHVLIARCAISGNDLTEDITPVEAGLTWTIAKSRREDCAFLGGEVCPGALKP